MIASAPFQLDFCLFQALPMALPGPSAAAPQVVAIGTLFKDMKLKPTIMDEYTKDR